MGYIQNELLLTQPFRKTEKNNWTNNRSVWSKETGKSATHIIFECENLASCRMRKSNILEKRDNVG